MESPIDTADRNEALAAFFRDILPNHKVLTDKESKRIWAEERGDWSHPYFVSSAKDFEQDMRRVIEAWHSELPIQRYKISVCAFPILDGRLDFDTYAKRLAPISVGAFAGSTEQIRRISVWRTKDGYFSTMPPATKMSFWSKLFGGGSLRSEDALSRKG
jgi:hypothetical protein